ncbi:M12 family metallopeptidase [Mycolicibacterium vaccae]|uniref:M12 family metallopeptidase n=1 Tax=Mycolicibacterium vaccae TaxID=1810 RepID=UPI003D0584E4
MDAEQLARALDEIGRIAAEATKQKSTITPDGHHTEDPAADIACGIKRLPARLNEQAAKVSVRMNPANAPLAEFLGVNAPLPDSPLALTITTAKYWGPSRRTLSVSFMESTPSDLRTRIVSHLNAWSTWIGISFAETAGQGDVRISRGPGGYYSYLGTDITLVPANRQTMNLEAFTMNTPESEFRRVIRHEAGHTLGFPHEHMRQELVARIDPAKAYPYFLATQGWPKEVVDQQVLTPLNNATILGTAADQDSIMCYQLPGSITFDGQPIRGGTDINASDFAFASLLYPQSVFGPEQVTGSTMADSDWGVEEDVDVPV